MKVHIVTPANKGLYVDELVQMHKLRHEIFVEELGWSALRSPDGLESDEFDDAAAVYLLAMEDGFVHGSLRLLPTWKRCMISERFAEWAGDSPVTPGGGSWEWTRWCPGTAKRARSLVKARGALIAAAVEFAVSRGIETYYTFCETKFLPQLIELGWNPQPLGLPRGFEEGQAIAVRWSVHPNQVEAARLQFRLKGPASLEAPAFHGFDARLSATQIEHLLFGASVHGRPLQAAVQGAVPRKPEADLISIAVQGTA